ncbi:MAG TPA: hypothetical protein VFN67_03745 [Polyangiales bacterium]|nr:hypothetical protein [Polyangiales bacterium]
MPRSRSQGSGFTESLLSAVGFVHVSPLGAASLLIALSWLVPAAFSASADVSSVRLLPLVLHIVQQDGVPVADEAFIEERLARANEIYAPYRVGFVVQERVPLPAAHAHLSSRADRDALASYLKRKVINCFVVASLRDVDEPERMRRGVHWHAATRGNAHFVIISTLGGRDVLSHELGHFLGNPEHSPTPGNLMSYEHGPMLPFLDAPQLKRLERSLRGYFKRGELVPAAAPRSSRGARSH